MKNLLQWQLASRVWGGELIAPWIGGTRLVVQRGMVGATGNLYAGLHEFEEMAFMLHFLRRGDLFADVGANVGSYSILAGGVVGARVVALEPIHATFEKLTRNIEVNGLHDSCSARNLAIGARSQVIRFISDADAMNRALPEGEAYAGQTTTVAVEPLDFVCSETPVLMKIDVEGFEDEVLLGAERTLADDRLRAFIVEVLHEVPSARLHGVSVPWFLRDRGWHPCRYEPFSRTLSTDERPELKGNLIFVRDFAEASARLREAASFQALGVSV